MNEDLFYKCSEINDYLIDGDEPKARDLLIQLLDYVGRNNIQYFPLLNSLIREVGLYPYMDVNSSEWEDAFVYNLFKADIGLNEEKVLHREQFRLLSSLLAGKNIAVSAPTSFGKSFVIDAFIKLRKPRNVAIIVPTIALTDETRRRIYKKFANEYNIITTTDIPLAERNIFIFPQERALCYVNKIDSLDILIVDEFYKSSKDFEKERSASLIKAIIKLGQIAKQKYYLAPNITKIEDNQFTKDMEFMKMDFNTVFLKVTDYYPQIGTDTQKKGEYFLNLNRTLKGKTLIYAGSFSNITSLSNLIPISCRDFSISLALSSGLTYIYALASYGVEPFSPDSKASLKLSPVDSIPIVKNNIRQITDIDKKFVLTLLFICFTINMFNPLK